MQGDPEFAVNPYPWIRELGVESLTDPDGGDEWFARLGECASAMGGQVTGHLRDATTGPFIEVRGVGPHGGQSDTRLLVYALDGGLALYAGGREEQPDEDVITFWHEAARCATARLGLAGDPIDWSALIGPPSPRIGGTETMLSEPVKLGDLSLAPEPRPLNESWSGRPASLLGRSIATTWLTAVEGRSRGYNWHMAGKAAALELHRVCTLLSVAGAGTVVVREPPAPLQFGRRTVPEKNPWETYDPSAGMRLPNEWKPEPWLIDAWARVTSTPWLTRALAAHLEGLTASYDHPSLALVAFIAAIEAVSNRLWIEHRCNECGGRLHIAARFRATLQTAVSGEEADFLGAAYRPRSKTVHEGHLHGSEGSAGVYSIGMLSRDPALNFEWGVVYRMGRASEALLRRSVQGLLPAQRVELPGE